MAAKGGSGWLAWFALAVGVVLVGLSSIRTDCGGHDPRAVARAQLVLLEAALQAYCVDHRAYPPSPSDHDGASILYAALCDPARPYLDWDQLAVLGAVSPDGWGTHLTPLPPGALQDPTRARASGPVAKPFVLLDPWGQPIHYCEWASRPKRGSAASLSLATMRRADPTVLPPVDPTGHVIPRGAGPAHDVIEVPHRLESYDLWSGGPDRRNDFGAPCSDDVATYDFPADGDSACPGGHSPAGPPRPAGWVVGILLAAGALPLLAAVALWRRSLAAFGVEALAAQEEVA
ncbi:MAG: hypothetical protein AB7N76_29740 [Planctomycetota bacterium]